MRVSLQRVIDGAWTKCDPVVLGGVPAPSRTPDRYILIEGDDGSKLRCDVYASSDPEYFFQEDVQIWRDLVVLGFGEKVYCVNLRTRAPFVHMAAPYFSSIETGDDFCLIASGEDVLRLREDGSLIWRSQAVAVDGVVVSDVTDGTIRGQGEWDPPGGWRDFSIDLATGRVLVQ